VSVNRDSTRDDDALSRSTAPQRVDVKMPRSPSTSDVHPVESGRRGSSHSDLQPGDVLEGRYTLLSPLGEGGMGDVWLALNATLDMEVALKVLRVDDKRPDLRAQMAQRLLQEARATAKLGHPAIVRIIDFGETPAGNAFYVMELLDGEDLQSLLERHGRLSAVKAVRTLLPIASALVAAHGKNIVHRDLKPENIYLARDREQKTVQPKLIDFGVARLRVANERITLAGMVLGSPGYMAPEQARGEDVDERADVWGFTVVLYEVITGQLPFDGANYNALLRAIIDDTPPKITDLGVGDEALSAIIERGLAKDVQGRWPSMRALGNELARWLLQRGVSDDICGAQLGASWMLDQSGAPIDSTFPPADPFVSAQVPAGVVDAARRERAEMLTTPQPAVLDTAIATSTDGRRSFARSRVIAIAAIAMGIGAGVAGGAWALRRPGAALETTALAPISQASEPSAVATLPAPVATATPEVALSSPLPSASVPATSASVAPPKVVRTPPKPRGTAAPQAAPPVLVLKNPY
jgi:eukaryotic-like serine/threonine-protein kinase